MVRKKRLNTDMEYLRSQTDAFQLELKNKFEMLQDMDDVETLNTNIVHILTEAAEKLGGKPRSSKQSKILDSTLQLLKKHCEMKVHHGYDNVEYHKICKTIRKDMRQDIRKYNVEIIARTIAQNKGMKATQLKLKEGK